MESPRLDTGWVLLMALIGVTTSGCFPCQQSQSLVQRPGRSPWMNMQAKEYGRGLRQLDESVESKIGDSKTNE